MGNTKIANIIYPEKFTTDFVYVYCEFEGELKELIEQSGYKQEFTRKYRTGINMLDKLKFNCFEQNRRFEHVQNSKDLFSMKLHGNKNIRIIFTFMEDDTKPIAVLLYHFQEKDDKNNSKTSYKQAIKIAEGRLSLLKA
jgi:hypothetical protein